MGSFATRRLDTMPVSGLTKPSIEAGERGEAWPHAGQSALPNTRCHSRSQVRTFTVRIAAPDAESAFPANHTADMVAIIPAAARTEAGRAAAEGCGGEDSGKSAAIAQRFRRRHAARHFQHAVWPGMNRGPSQMVCPTGFASSQG